MQPKQQQRKELEPQQLGLGVRREEDGVGKIHTRTGSSSKEWSRSQQRRTLRRIGACSMARA